MLSSLYIKNLAIIDELNISFNEGLNIITGETGAGKSLIIKAIQLLMGRKFSPEILRTGSDTLVVEGNFNEHNNNKKSGGIRIYNVKAPDSWSFQKYNRNLEEIYKMLDEKKAKCISIPHKFNRAVLFNSDYFHKTDELNFTDKYEARRINVTYLFGDRKKPKLI